MDEATLDKIREAAKQNGIDPDELIKAVQTDALPPEFQDAIYAIMGDLGTFGEALRKLDKET